MTNRNGDEPEDVARRGYDALINGEHRAYGSNQVKLMGRIGNLIPNELLAKSTRTFMEEK